MTTPRDAPPGFDNAPTGIIKKPELEELLAAARAKGPPAATPPGPEQTTPFDDPAPAPPPPRHEATAIMSPAQLQQAIAQEQAAATARAPAAPPAFAQPVTAVMSAAQLQQAIAQEQAATTARAPAVPPAIAQPVTAVMSAAQLQQAIAQERAATPPPGPARPEATALMSLEELRQATAVAEAPLFPPPSATAAKLPVPWQASTAPQAGLTAADGAPAEPEDLELGPPRRRFRGPLLVALLLVAALLAAAIATGQHRLALAWLGLDQASSDGSGTTPTEDVAVQPATAPEADAPRPTQPPIATTAAAGAPSAAVAAAPELRGSITAPDPAAAQGPTPLVAASAPAVASAGSAAPEAASTPGAEERQLYLDDNDVTRVRWRGGWLQIVRFPGQFAPGASTPAAAAEAFSVLRTALAPCVGPIVIAGHAARPGEGPDDRALSLARARHVERGLVAAGVERGRIVVEAAGTRYPIKFEDDQEARAINRRVNIRCQVSPP